MEKSLHEILIKLETRLHLPEIRHDPSELKRLLAEEFIEFGSSGRVYDLTAIIDELGGEEGAQIEIEDFKVINLTPDLALATYRAAYIEKR